MGLEGQDLLGSSWAGLGTVGALQLETIVKLYCSSQQPPNIEGGIGGNG